MSPAKIFTAAKVKPTPRSPLPRRRPTNAEASPASSGSEPRLTAETAPDVEWKAKRPKSPDGPPPSRRPKSPDGPPPSRRMTSGAGAASERLGHWGNPGPGCSKPTPGDCFLPKSQSWTAFRYGATNINPQQWAGQPGGAVALLGQTPKMTSPVSWLPMAGSWWWPTQREKVRKAILADVTKGLFDDVGPHLGKVLHRSRRTQSRLN